MKKIRWLHLSDLHFGLDSYFVEHMRNQMLPYIKANLLDKEFNYLFITGDFKYSKTCKNYPDECAKFISELADSLNIPRNNIVIVAGNHDSDRTDARRDVCAGVIADYNKNQYKLDNSRYKVLKDSQLKFRNFTKKIVTYDLSKKIKNNPHFVITDQYINILCIDSSLVSCKDGERGTLVLGREFLQSLLMELDRNKPTIAISHYPFDWLEKGEAEQLELILKESGVKVYLCGHQHVVQAKNIQDVDQVRDLHEIICGTMIDEAKPYNDSEMGFSVGEIDLSDGSGDVQAYIYKKSVKDGWHKDNTFALSQNSVSGNYIIKKN